MTPRAPRTPRRTAISRTETSTSMAAPNREHDQIRKERPSPAAPFSYCGVLVRSVGLVAPRLEGAAEGADRDDKKGQRGRRENDCEIQHLCCYLLQRPLRDV